MQLSIIVPFYNGQRYIDKLLSSISSDIPVLIVDDCSTEPYKLNSKNKNHYFHRMAKKGYFTGAVNRGIELTATDILMLNQDAWLEGTNWLDLINGYKDNYALIGQRIQGNHPAWENGYIHGTFMFIRRDVIDKIGLMNEIDFPLWGSTCEYQVRACRAGFHALPLQDIPGFHHDRKGGFGEAINDVLTREPKKKSLFIRTPPLVSVITTSHNYGKYLPDLVNSLVGGETSMGRFEQQSFAAFELIIVNDASTDDTEKIAKSLADPMKGIRYVKREVRGGSAAANNTGIKNAYGRYITIMGGDDMRVQDALEKLYRAQIKNPHSMIYDNIACFANGVMRPDIKVGVADYDFERLLVKNHIHAGIIFPKQAWVEAGGYPEIFDDGREDWAFNIALGRVGYCGIRIPNYGYLYRREGQNRSLRNGYRQDYDKYRAKLFSTFPDLYKGERPTMCCGHKTRGIPSDTQIIQNKAIREVLVDMENLVLIKYIGRSAGTQSFYGIKTGSRYVAGLNHAVVAVDKKDLYGSQTRPGLLEMRESGKPIFKLMEMLPAVKAQPKPKVETKVAHKVDLDTMTLPQLKRMSLTPLEVANLLRQEKKGKNRKSIISYLEGINA